MHYKIKHSCAVVRWIGRGDVLEPVLRQDPRHLSMRLVEQLLFGEQRSTMAKFACLSMLDACDNHYHKHSTYHNGLGNCLIAVL